MFSLPSSASTISSFSSSSSSSFPTSAMAETESMMVLKLVEEVFAKTQAENINWDLVSETLRDEDLFIEKLSSSSSFGPSFSSTTFPCGSSSYSSYSSYSSLSSSASTCSAVSPASSAEADSPAHPSWVVDAPANPSPFIFTFSNGMASATSTPTSFPLFAASAFNFSQPPIPHTAAPCAPASAPASAAHQTAYSGASATFHAGGQVERGLDGKSGDDSMDQLEFEAEFERGEYEDSGEVDGEEEEDEEEEEEEEEGEDGAEFVDNDGDEDFLPPSAKRSRRAKAYFATSPTTPLSAAAPVPFHQHAGDVSGGFFSTAFDPSRVGTDAAQSPLAGTVPQRSPASKSAAARRKAAAAAPARRGKATKGHAAAVAAAAAAHSSADEDDEDSELTSPGMRTIVVLPMSAAKIKALTDADLFHMTLADFKKFLRSCIPADQHALFKRRRRKHGQMRWAQKAREQRRRDRLKNRAAARAGKAAAASSTKA